MKLYYSTGACSLSPHIVIKELGLPATVLKVDIRKKLLEDGSSYLKVNPKGQVPALALDSGDVLTEGVAIIQYLADLAPEKGLVPRGNTIERYRLLEWLNFIATEVHKGFSPLFSPDQTEEAKTAVKERLTTKLAHFDVLKTQSHLMGENFTVADAYLFTVLSWADYVKLSLPDHLKEYLKRVSGRPSVQAALREEGLLK